MLVLKGLVGLHRTVQFQLLQHYWLGHRLGSGQGGPAGGDETPGAPQPAEVSAAGEQQPRAEWVRISELSVLILPLDGGPWSKASRVEDRGSPMPEPPPSRDQG